MLNALTNAKNFTLLLFAIANIHSKHPPPIYIRVSTNPDSIPYDISFDEEYEAFLEKTKANSKHTSLLLTQTMKNTEETKGIFTDPRDGKTYKTAKIGTETWLAENLNYEAEGSVCYENNPANCAKYGHLYNWETAMKACLNERGIC